MKYIACIIQKIFITWTQSEPAVSDCVFYSSYMDKTDVFGAQNTNDKRGQIDNVRVCKNAKTVKPDLCRKISKILKNIAKLIPKRSE